MDSIHHPRGYSGRFTKQVEIDDRTCSVCGTADTYITKQGWKEWRRDGRGGWICSNCPRRIDTNGRQITIKWLQLIGICNFCCAVKGVNTKKTDWHHQKGFIIIFPWYGIIELCSKCHIKEMWRLGEIKRENLSKVRKEKIKLGLIIYNPTNRTWIKKVN